MICKHESAPGQWRFVLAPNRSASWAQIQRFFGLIAGVSAAIAVTFSFMGFWPVLPFAGAELALLWYCFYLNATKGLESEVIDINDRTVDVERGMRTVQQRWKFPRAWTRVQLLAAPARLHPSQLLLRSHGKTVRLGAFLTEDERHGVAKELRSVLTARVDPHPSN